MNTWFQEGQPSSYKIQLRYTEIPQHLQLPKKVVDTPFRFRTFEEAQKASLEMFDGYDVQVVGSMDNPHWQEPEATLNKAELKKSKWYDIYGMTPVYRLDYNRQRAAQIADSVKDDKTFRELQGLHSLPVPRTVGPISSAGPAGAQRRQGSQGVQRGQRGQSMQRVQGRQKTQRGERGESG